jgi:hypothetical protein
MAVSASVSQKQPGWDDKGGVSHGGGLASHKPYKYLIGEQAGAGCEPHSR